jgi:K+-sensing histidine kinase KdpD
VAVALSTLVFYPGRDHFAKGQWAILYLLVVVLVAGLSGTRPAILAAVLAFFCWNYFFLPPYHALHVADTEDWLSLVAFLVAGIVMGAQTGRLRAREARAVAREREAAAINRLSTYLVSEVPTATMADTLLVETVRLLGAERAALFLPDDDGRLRPVAGAPEDASGPGPSVEAAAAWCLANNQALGLPGLPHEDDGPSPRPVPPDEPPPEDTIDHALVYSPADSEVRVAAADVDDRTEIWIEDCGPGVPPEERERIFEKFYRGKRMTGRAPSGTGLGLAIAREIVTAHGGTIGVTAAAAGGARFEIALPKTADTSRRDKGVGG